MAKQYYIQFENFISHQSMLSGEQQLWQFSVGLTDSLRKEVPETIFAAMKLAKLNEYKMLEDKRTRSFGGYSAPTTKTAITPSTAAFISSRDFTLPRAPRHWNQETDAPLSTRIAAVSFSTLVDPHAVK